MTEEGKGAEPRVMHLDLTRGGFNAPGFAQIIEESREIDKSTDDKTEDA